MKASCEFLLDIDEFELLSVVNPTPVTIHSASIIWSYIVLGLVDVLIELFDRYFFGNGFFTALFAPVNLFVDLFCYRNFRPDLAEEIEADLVLMENWVTTGAACSSWKEEIASSMLSACRIDIPFRAASAHIADPL